MIIFSLHSQSSSSPPFNRPENHFNHLRSLPLKMPLTVSYLLLVFRWNLSILLFNTVVIDAPKPQHLLEDLHTPIDLSLAGAFDLRLQETKRSLRLFFGFQSLLRTAEILCTCPIRVHVKLPQCQFVS